MGMIKAPVDFAEQRILLVENHMLMRRLLREMLRGFGAQQVSEARNVPQAIDLIYTEPFDVVVLDFFLGDLDGADFARLVRHDESCRNREVPILLVTAWPDHHRVLKGLKAGIDGMLAKPIAPRDLYLRLHALLSRPRTFVISNDYVGPSRRGAKPVQERPQTERLIREALRRTRVHRRPETKGRGLKDIDEALFA